MRRPVGGRLERERRRAGREEGGGDHEPALRRRRVGPERRVLRRCERQWRSSVVPDVSDCTKQTYILHSRLNRRARRRANPRPQTSPRPWRGSINSQFAAIDFFP